MGNDGYAQVPPSTNSIIVAPGANSKTVALWQKHQKDTGAYGQTWIGPYINDSKTTSGKRDTIIFVPSQFDRTRQADVIVWLHGHYGFNKFAQRILRHLPARYARGENIIVIAVEQPWTRNGSTPTSRNKTGPFRRDGEFSTWVDTIVFPALNFFNVKSAAIVMSKITIYGHSAGGSGILSMSRSDALSIATPGTIVFSDSTYGSWFREFYDNFYKGHPQTNVVVLVRRGGPTHKSMTQFFHDRPAAKNLTTLKYMVLDRKTWTHRRIGDNCVLYPGPPFPP